MIYVDDLFVAVSSNGKAYALGQRYGHRWCHLFSSLGGAAGDAELLKFGERLGLRPEWLQRHPLGNHFDLTPPRRAEAVMRGAKECSAREGVNIRRVARGAPPLSEVPRVG